MILFAFRLLVHSHEFLDVQTTILSDSRLPQVCSHLGFYELIRIEHEEGAAEHHLN